MPRRRRAGSHLAPPATEVAIRAYGIGLLPLDGTFAQFRGSLTYDPDDHAACQVDLAIDVASLAMSNDLDARRPWSGPDFMDARPLSDADLFRDLPAAGSQRDAGACTGSPARSQLSLDLEPGRVVAEGQLVRADWGMTAMPIVAGRTVRIQVTVPLAPPSHASRE